MKNTISGIDFTTYSRLHLGDFLLPADCEQKVIPPFKVRYISLCCSE